MAVKTTYRSTTYPTLTGTERRYVRCSTDGYAWCITDPKTGLDVRQGTCEVGDVPADIREKANVQAGTAFSYVDWPQ